MRPGVRRWARVGAFLGSLALAGGATSAGLAAWLSGVDVSKRSTRIERGAAIHDRAARIPAALHDRWVGMLGDSTVEAYPPGQTVPDRLDAALRKLAPGRFATVALAAPGYASFEYYTIAGGLIAQRPAFVVVPVNLASFSNVWVNNFRQVQLIAWVPWSWLPELFVLPLQEWGVTFDAALASMSGRSLGLTDALDAYARWQIRADDAIGSLRRRLGAPGDERTGLPAQRRWAVEGEGKRRPNALGARVRYGAALDGVDPDHPELQMLGAMLTHLRAAGVTALVYVVPLNVEQLEALGLADPEGLGRSIASIGAVAAASGQPFLDLHDFFPDEAFRDAGGHFTYAAGELSGTRLLSERLATEILRLDLERAARPRAGAGGGAGVRS